MFRDLKDTPLGKRFNNERMDIFYYFFHVSLDFLNNKGINAFITTNYYLTADSAVKLRKDIKARAMLFKLLNFNEFKVFESAMGQHSILTFLTKNQCTKSCDIINISRLGVADSALLEKILLKQDSQTTYYTYESDKLFEGDKNYIRLNYGNAKIVQTNDQILDKIKEGKKTLGHYCSISQGIVTGIDKISPKHILRHPEFAKYKDFGVYVISSSEKKSIGKSSLLKPWFKNSDIIRYYVKDVPEKWLIHTSTEINLDDYGNIATHLLFFKKLILERNYESGELTKAKRLKRWWALSSSRWEFDFDKPKIVSPQRSYLNTFAYTEKEWYASADVYFITDKLKEMPLKYYLGILNSKVIFFWLYNRGKRKGDMLELYLTPLSEIPIPKDKNNYASKIVKLVENIIEKKKENSEIDTSSLERQIDELVYKLYELTEEEIKIIEGHE
jgi:adenine-specific DNA-methyltransferase